MQTEPVFGDRITCAITLRLFSAAFIATMDMFTMLAGARGASLVETLFARQAIDLPLITAAIALGTALCRDALAAHLADAAAAG